MRTLACLSMLVVMGGAAGCLDISGLSDFEVQQGTAGGAAGGPSAGGGGSGGTSTAMGGGGAGGAGGGCTNHALELDGTDDWVIVPDDPALDVSDRFTVEAWIRPDSDFNNDEAHLLAHSNFGANLGWAFLLRNRVVEFRVHDGGVMHRCIGNQTLNQNEWVHVAGAFRGNQIVCFVNGVEDMLERLGTNVIPMAYAGDLHIGANVNGDDFFFGGLIDDIRISSVARNFMGVPTAPPAVDGGTVALWRFEGTGNEMTDDTGQHDGVRNDPPGGQPARVPVPCEDKGAP